MCFLQNQGGFLTMLWHNYPHSCFHCEWPDCQQRGSQWHHHRKDSISITMCTLGYIFLPGCSPYPHPPITICKVEPFLSLELLLKSNVQFLYSNITVDCLTMDPSLDSSFGNWMSKMCNKLLHDMGQWEKSDALSKPSNIALITGCGLLWMTTTWQSLPSTSFPIPFSNPLYGRNWQSNLSAISWAVWPASGNSTTIFCCCSHNKSVCVWYKLL